MTGLVAATVTMAAAVVVLDLAIRAGWDLDGGRRVPAVLGIDSPGTAVVVGGLAVLLSGAAMACAARRAQVPRLVLLTGPTLLLLMAWNCFEVGYRTPVQLGPLVGGIVLVVAGTAPLTVVRSLVRRPPSGDRRPPPAGRTADGPMAARQATRVRRSLDAAVVREPAPMPAPSTRPDRYWMERLMAPDGGVPASRVPFHDHPVREVHPHRSAAVSAAARRPGAVRAGRVWTPSGPHGG